MSAHDITYVSGRAFVDKDPDAELDYSFDWTDWLAAVGDSIASHEILVEAPLEVVSSQRVGAVVTAFVRGGADGTTRGVTCRVITNSSPPRKDDRTLYLQIRQT